MYNKDMSGVICEVGCNIGQTSLRLLKEYENITLLSYDINKTATDVCEYIKDGLKINNWFIYNKNITELDQEIDTVIWEDPHTASDEEYKEIIKCLKKHANTIYFLSCDNIKHLLIDVTEIEERSYVWTKVVR
jgi:methylase of polypeptide subunit release factors